MSLLLHTIFCTFSLIIPITKHITWKKEYQANVIGDYGNCIGTNHFLS